MNNSPKILDLKIPMGGLSYTLTGNDRDATKSAASDSAAISTDIRNGGATVTFNKGQVLKIVKARLIPVGAPGLQPGVGLNAADLKMVQGTGSFTKNPGSPEVPLSFLKYDTWEDKDFRMEFTEDGSVLGIGTGSQVSVDDYNISSDYVGQDADFTIEAIAELYIGV